MSVQNKLRELIRKLIQKELAEASSTATAGNIHYKTPYAFKKNKKGKKKKKAGYGGGSYQPTIGTDNFLAKDPKLRKESVNEVEIKKSKLRLLKVNTKYTADEVMDLYKELNNRDVDSELVIQYLDTIKDRVKMMRKNVGLKESAVNEGKYHDFRNDDSLTTKQKIGMAMRETRDSLKNLEKIVDMNLRLKNELNVDSRDYWKNTHKALHKISERLVKLAGKVGQLR